MSESAHSEVLTPAGAFLAPYLPSQDYLLPAWFGLLQYALSAPDILAAFRLETGNMWQPGTTGIERMIDTATGAEQAFLTQFAGWMNANLWGESA